MYDHRTNSPGHVRIFAIFAHVANDVCNGYTYPVRYVLFYAYFCTR